ncbi:phosphatase [Sulfurovum sp. TSL1]|uniref:Ppx/GppA phosphatase family protein n=1 Tax=Sulfurovum sp. TSL1 TaxID=2826994 RepID=UPI001CC51A76|nr:phosphatase [Sulfurovum sp. TSL1]GIT98328.1 exopolyphosphatase [Sulfurovum sp. TSL1]
MIAIDLGSNTLRVLEYECSTGRHTAEFEKVVKTADGLAQYGVINDEAVKKVISAIQEAQEQIDFSSSLVRAVTTEAVRRAVNSDEVLSRIKKETGVHFDIISGEEEARLTLLAVRHRLSTLQDTSESFVLIDIGGGSTELIFHYGDETVSKSFPLGIVTIAQTYETLEKIEKVLPKEMAEMQRFCENLYHSKSKVNAFVATAGTPTTVAAMKLGQNYETYDASKINGTSLAIEELDFYLKELLSMPFEEREIAVGTGRSDLIAAGILIYKQLFRLLGFESCIVIDDGLREGVAIEACGHQAH